MQAINKKYLVAAGVLAFATAAITGWKAGRGNASQQGPKMSTTSESSRRISQELETTAMAQVRSQKSGHERLRSTIEMARTLPASEIKEWLEREKFDQRGGFELNLFVSILFERWSEEKPEEFVAWITGNGIFNYKDSTYIAFAAKEHPELFSKAIIESKDFNYRNNLFRNLVEVNPAIALETLRQMMPVSESEIDMYPLSELIKSSPAGFQALIEETDGAPRIALEAAFARQKLISDFDQTFDSIVNDPSGYQYLFGRNGVAGSIDSADFISRLKDFPPKWREEFARNSSSFSFRCQNNPDLLTLDFKVRGFSESESKSIRKELLRVGAQFHSEKTFSLIDQDGLTPDEKRVILKNALNTRLSDEELAGLTPSLTNPDDQAIFEQLVKDRKAAQELRSTPGPDLLAQIREGGENLNNPQLPGQIRNLKPEQKTELANSFRGSEGDEKSRLAEFLLKTDHGVIPEVKGEVIEYLLDPTNSSRVAGSQASDPSRILSETSWHALELMKTDPKAAFDWVEHLPEGKARLYAQKNLVYNWRNYNPEGARNWLDARPAGEKAALLEILKE